MKKRENKSWTKRITAVVLAACMVLTTPASLLADDVAEEPNAQSAAEDGFTSGDFETESSDTSGQSKADGENENQTSGDGFVSDEGKSDAGDLTGNQASPDNTGADDSENPSNDANASDTDNQTDDTTKEDQKIQLSLQLLSDASETTYTQSPALSLMQADGLSEKITVKENKLIEATDGEGLILLSNVEPKEYQDYTIKLIAITGWDLTKTVTVNNTAENSGTDAGTATSYGFLGLGSEAAPYQGIFQLDESTAAKQYSISTLRALFNALSTKATLSGTIPFSFSENAVATNKPLLAETIIAGDGSKPLEANIALRDLNTDKIQDPVIGGLIGALGANASAKITFTNQFPKELTVRAENHTGLFCNTMETGSSLTAVLEETNSQGIGSVKVAAAADGADAGGFVGHMEANARLTVAGCSVNQVSSASGNEDAL